MAKYDAVDRLMSLATDKPSTKGPLPEDQELSPAKNEAAEPTAHDVLEARVATAERGVPAAATDAPERASGSTALGHPRATPTERGRQILGALRPFLPVVGGALRMVDHGAVQAVARLLPLLGGAAGGAAAAGSSAQDQQHLTDVLTAFDQQHTALTDELKRQKSKAEILEEQLRRTRETVERIVAEQGLQAHQVILLTDRTKLLLAAVIVLFLAVVAEAVFTGMFLRR